MTENTPSTHSQWKNTVRTLGETLSVLSRDNTGAVVVPDGLRDVISKQAHGQWDNNKRVFVYGKLPLDTAIMAAEAELLLWWPVFTGRAYFGELDELRAVQAAATKALPDEESRPSCSSALTWICYPHKLTDGVKNNIREDVTRQLLEWGADPNHDNGSWLEKALNNLEAPIIGAYIDHGAALDTISRVLERAQNSKNNDLTQKLRSAISGRTFLSPVGKDTLQETKIMPDKDGLSVFKTIFNFSAQRVQEIYEGAKAQTPVVISMDMDAYSVVAVEQAKQQLRRLGGDPSTPTVALDKKPAPRAMLKRTGQGSAP